MILHEGAENEISPRRTPEEGEWSGDGLIDKSIRENSVPETIPCNRR